MGRPRPDGSSFSRAWCAASPAGAGGARAGLVAAAVAAVALGGCALTLSGPQRGRQRHEVPRCDTSKAFVAVDGVIGATLGVATLAALGEDAGSAALVPGTLGALFILAAMSGNGKVNSCREALEAYETEVARGPALAGDELRRPAALGPSGGGPPGGAPPVAPRVAPSPSAPSGAQLPPRPVAVQPPPVQPVQLPRPPAVAPPVAQPQPPPPPRPAPAPPPPPRPAPASPPSSDPWAEFWKELP